MYTYATFKTRQKAEQYLEHMFASGTVSECELYGDGILRRGGRWHIVLRTEGDYR